MTSELAFAPVRHEPVAQHQVGRDRPEQLLIDPELVHVDEFEPIALRQLARPRDFLGVVLRIRQDRLVRSRLPSVATAHVTTTELNSKSGIYSARTTAAMTMPMTTSSDRLDQRDEPRHLGLDFLVVELGQAVEHLLQRAGGLPDFDHLDGHVREDLPRSRAPRQSSALPGRARRPRPARVAMISVRQRADAISSALTSGIPPPSSVASVRASCAVENFRAVAPSHGMLEQPSVESMPAGPAGETRRARDDQANDRRPRSARIFADDAVRNRDDDPRRQWQWPVKIRIEVRESRHHLQDDDANEDDHHRDQDRPDRSAPRSCVRLTAPISFS